MEHMSAKDFVKRFGGGIDPLSEPTKMKPQIRLPKAVKMNKTEAEWYELLKRKFVPNEEYRIEYEPLTIRLRSGTRYTPDFVVMAGRKILGVYEVKGAHIHNSRSILAFKEARSMYPDWNFTFAQKTKDGWLTA
jgi:hypothetical protein